MFVVSQSVLSQTRRQHARLTEFSADLAANVEQSDGDLLPNLPGNLPQPIFEADPALESALLPVGAALEPDLRDHRRQPAGLARDVHLEEVLHVRRADLDGDLLPERFERAPDGRDEADLLDHFGGSQAVLRAFRDADDGATLPIDFDCDIGRGLVRASRRARDLTDDLVERVALIVPENGRKGTARRGREGLSRRGGRFRFGGEAAGQGQDLLKVCIGVLSGGGVEVAKNIDEGRRELGFERVHDTAFSIEFSSGHSWMHRRGLAQHLSDGGGSHAPETAGPPRRFPPGLPRTVVFVGFRCRRRLDRDPGNLFDAAREVQLGRRTLERIEGPIEGADERLPDSSGRDGDPFLAILVFGTTFALFVHGGFALLLRRELAVVAAVALAALLPGLDISAIAAAGSNAGMSRRRDVVSELDMSAAMEAAGTEDASGIDAAVTATVDRLARLEDVSARLSSTRRRILVAEIACAMSVLSGLCGGERPAVVERVEADRLGEEGGTRSCARFAICSQRPVVQCEFNARSGCLGVQIVLARASKRVEVRRELTRGQRERRPRILHPRLTDF